MLSSNFVEAFGVERRRGPSALDSLFVISASIDKVHKESRVER